MKRKPTEVWFAINKKDGDVDDWGETRQDLAAFWGETHRYVRLVEHNPTAEQVVKATLALERLKARNLDFGPRLVKAFKRQALAIAAHESFLKKGHL